MLDKKIYSTAVLKEWLDYNGHMNDAYYAVVFSEAVDALMISIGIDKEYRDKTANSFFTLQAQICYVKEALFDQDLYVDYQILGFDRKRLHLFFNLYRQEDNVLLATSEQMLLHVDMNIRKATVFDSFIGSKIVRLWAQHKDLPKPHQAGRNYIQLSNSL